MRSRGLYVAVLVLMNILPATVNAESNWTVDDCIAYAIEHNPAVRNKRIDTDMARVDVLSAYGDFLPSVSITGLSGRRFGHSVDPVTNQYTSEAFFDNTVGVNVSFSLFEGLTRLNRVRFARLNKAMSGYVAKAAENSLALDIAEAFYRYCFDAGMYELAVEQRRLGERYFEKMTEYVKLGIRPRSEISELKARLQADIYQERLKARDCELSMSALKELMGMDEADSLTIIPEKVSDLPSLANVDLTALYESARIHMPEYQIMVMRDKASRTAVSLAAGAIYPTVRMEFNLTSGFYTARDRSGAVASFSSQLRNNLNSYIGISVSMPLFDGLRRYNDIRKKKMRYRQVTNDNERQRQAIERDIYEIYVSAQTVAEEWLLALEQLEAASVVLNSNEERLHEGIISGFELMESRKLYIQAGVEKIRAGLHYILTSKIINFYRTGSFRDIESDANQSR